MDVPTPMMASMWQSGGVIDHSTGRADYHSDHDNWADLTKNVFQVHGANERGKTMLRKQLRPEQVAAFFAKLPSCLIGMEAP